MTEMKVGDIQRFLILVIVMGAFLFMVVIVGLVLLKMEINVVITDFDLQSVVGQVILALTGIVTMVGTAYFVSKNSERSRNGSE